MPVFDELFDFFRDNRDIISTGAGIFDYFQDKGASRDLKRFSSSGAIDPFGQANRSRYQNELNALTSDPSRVEALPGFRFARDQGEKAINRNAAARGQYFSGNAITELTNYNQRLAGQFYDEEIRRLMRLSGADFAPNAGTAGSLYSQGIQYGLNAPGQLTAGLNRGSQQDGISSLLNAFSSASKIPGVLENFAPELANLFGPSTIAPSAITLGGAVPGVGSLFAGGPGIAGALGTGPAVTGATSIAPSAITLGGAGQAPAGIGALFGGSGTPAATGTGFLAGTGGAATVQI